jgi:membrane associated rhomboid family serine protease
METTTPHEPVDDHGSLGGAIVNNPVVQTLFTMGLVSVATWTGLSAGNIEPFVLQAPVHDPWWQIITSIYAHATPGHLLSNAVLILVAGGLISLSTTWFRFHLFFLLTGALAGISHVWATDALGTPVGILGASGAAFALAGYVLTANPASASILDWIPVRAVLGILAALALAMTVMWSGPESAYIAHLVGALIGLLAGHYRLLRA